MKSKTTFTIRRIMGLPFFVGSLEDLLNLSGQGGLIVFPSAPVLVDMMGDAAQRHALETSDLAVTDSGYFVLLWRIIKGEWLPRISGLRYLRALLEHREFQEPAATFWVMPSGEDDAANCAWLERRGISVPGDCRYIAPFYPAGKLADPALLEQILRWRPRFIVINLGGGVQERLGHFLRSSLPYRPTIICTGAAIAFLSGRQASIPVYIDRLFLGWLLRILRNPIRFLPRYWRSLRLVPLVARDRSPGPTQVG